MPKVKDRSVSITVIKQQVRKRRSSANRGPSANPAKPLAQPSREIFAQLISQGINTIQAYKEAGYKGSPATRSALRTSKDVDSRIAWLLDRRILDDAKARHKRQKPVGDLKDRVLARLEAMALGDVRDLAQWTKAPKFDEDGNLIEMVDQIDITPSHALTSDQAAMVKRIIKKGGDIQFETNDQLAAIDKLLKVLGLYQDAGPSILTQNTVNNVSISGQDNALEAVRRLAFAIAKAEHSQSVSPLTIESHANPEHSPE